MWSPEAGQAQGTAPTANAPDWKHKKRKARQGPTAKPWNYPNAQAVLEEIGKAAPAYAGMRWETLGEAGVQWPSAAMARIARKPESAEIAPLAAPDAGSFYLVGGSLLWDGGSVMQHAAEQVRGLIPQPFVALTPADLAALKLVEGDAVVVSASDRNVGLTSDGRCIGATRDRVGASRTTRLAGGSLGRRARRAGVGEVAG